MDFVAWIEKEMSEREWSRADLARKGKLTTAQVTRVLNRQQNAGHVFCEGIARAFGLPFDMVYRRAGLLPDERQPDEWVASMSYKLSLLPKELRDIAETIIESLANKEKQK